MTAERWVEAVVGLLGADSDAKVVDSGTNPGAVVYVVVEHPAGGFVTLFLGSRQTTRGYSFGWDSTSRPKVTSGMYTGQNWHRRVVRDAWKALDDMARS